MTGRCFALPQVMRPRCLCTGALLTAFLYAACSQGPTSTPELQAVLAAEAAPEGVAEVVWADAKSFYVARADTLAWLGADGPTGDTVAALDVLRAADSHGLDPETYHESSLRAQLAALESDAADDGTRSQQIANLDVRLTCALLQLGRHVATGRLDPKRVDSRWNARRESPDYVSALTRAGGGEVAAFLEHVQPRHPEYAALRESLTAVRQQSANRWPPVASTSLKFGDANAGIVIPLRQRLARSGYLDAQVSLQSPQYDGDVEVAVKRFQEHHGLPATGTLDRATIRKLNVPIDQRIAQIAMNLERWRWLPDDLGARHFLVNVPQFQLVAREQGHPVLDMRVVVGKRGNETPLFTDKMETIVFSPYWNIPETIALEETAPAVARDPNYLERNNMEILDSAGEVVSADMIPWDDEGALADYRFRQRPGAGNALGYVKFLFPNEHAVYLHDTPADELFKRLGRAFSHGCIRVEEPERLAAYVLRDKPEWTPEAISTSMRSGNERHVRLREPIPIYIIYMTAWVDANGGLHFQDDVYGYDARQARL